MATNKYYIEAFDKNGDLILGDSDGQGILYASNYKKTSYYKTLKAGFFRKKVQYHEIREAITREVVEVVLQNESKIRGKFIKEKVNEEVSTVESVIG